MNVCSPTLEKTRQLSSVAYLENGFSRLLIHPSYGQKRSYLGNLPADKLQAASMASRQRSTFGGDSGIRLTYAAQRTDSTYNLRWPVRTYCTASQSEQAAPREIAPRDNLKSGTSPRVTIERGPEPRAVRLQGTEERDDSLPDKAQQDDSKKPDAAPRDAVETGIVHPLDAPQLSTTPRGATLGALIRTAVPGAKEPTVSLKLPRLASDGGQKQSSRLEMLTKQRTSGSEAPREQINSGMVKFLLRQGLAGGGKLSSSPLLPSCRTSRFGQERRSERYISSQSEFSNVSFNAKYSEQTEGVLEQADSQGGKIEHGVSNSSECSHRLELSIRSSVSEVGCIRGGSDTKLQLPMPQDSCNTMQELPISQTNSDQQQELPMSDLCFVAKQELPVRQGLSPLRKTAIQYEGLTPSVNVKPSGKSSLTPSPVTLPTTGLSTQSSDTSDSDSVRFGSSDETSLAGPMSAQEASYREARARLVLLLASFVACYVVSYSYAQELLYVITRPFQAANPKFMFTSILEALSATNQLCIVASALACTPLGAYYYWAYFVPSCFQYERPAFTYGVVRAVGLVYCGAVCSYLVLPRLLNLMLTSSAPFMSEGIEAEAGGATGVQYSARIDSYVQLAVRLLVLAPLTAWAAVTKVSLLSGGCVLLMFTGTLALTFEANVIWSMAKTIMARAKP